MRITNKNKFIRSILLILVMILFITFFIGKSTLSHKEIEYKTIYVSQGDTKANQISNSYYKNKDVRYIISDLMKINNLENSNININQKLLIPCI